MSLHQSLFRFACLACLLAAAPAANQREVERIQVVAKLGAAKESDHDQWKRLLKEAGPEEAKEVVRQWRRFQEDDEMTAALVAEAPRLLQRDPGLASDLVVAFRNLMVAPRVYEQLGLSERPPRREELKAHVLGKWNRSPEARAARGVQVFERAGCSKCHTIGPEVKIGPSLQGVGTQPVETILESILEPSKVIKPGFEPELIETRSGEVLVGLVKQSGQKLHVTNATGEVEVDLAAVKKRRKQTISIMPEGLENPISREELTDLVSYLMAQKNQK